MPILAHGVYPLHYGQRTMININVFSVHCPLSNVDCHVSYQSIYAITVLCASLSLLGFPSLYVFYVSPKQCLGALRGFFDRTWLQFYTFSQDSVKEGMLLLSAGCSFYIRQCLYYAIAIVGSIVKQKPKTGVRFTKHF